MKCDTGQRLYPIFADEVQGTESEAVWLSNQGCPLPHLLLYLLLLNVLVGLGDGDG